MSQAGGDENKIIYLISPSRSLSVAFTRVFNELPGITIFNEPSQFAYTRQNLHLLGKFASLDALETVFKKESPQNFQEVKSRLFAAQKNGTVFAKEISYAVNDFLKADLEFVANRSVRFVFLVRNPHHAAVSFYKKTSDERLGNWDFWSLHWSDWLGYQATLGLFTLVKDHAVHRPIIILAEDLYNLPEETISQLCQQLGIKFQPQALQFSPVDLETLSMKWHELKHSDHSLVWHQKGMESMSIQVPEQYEVDGQNNPTFSEVREEHQEFVRKAYEENLTFYQEVLKFLDYVQQPFVGPR